MGISHFVRKIYEDESFLAIDKPPGLVVDSADTLREETLADILTKDFGIKLPRGGIVHRLDKDTSGVLLVAKTEEALNNLQAQFKERITKKEYTVLAHGNIAESGKIEGSIGRNPGNREKFTVLEGDPTSLKLRGVREAVTEYEPIKKLQFTIYNLFSKLPSVEQSIFNDLNKIQMRKLEKQHYGEFTLVKCMPKTGRTHQIRVHLKYINHPIVADSSYTGRKMLRLDNRWCPRIFLHAAKIGFNHPKTDEWMEISSPLPEDLRKALDRLSSRTE